MRSARGTCPDPFDKRTRPELVKGAAALGPEIWAAKRHLRQIGRRSSPGLSDSALGTDWLEIRGKISCKNGLSPRDMNLRTGTKTVALRRSS
ncbi:MAG: hypothetical protein ABSF52_10610 [Syntrophobacteraceae bacterium]